MVTKKAKYEIPSKIASLPKSLVFFVGVNVVSIKMINVNIKKAAQRAAFIKI